AIVRDGGPGHRGPDDGGDVEMSGGRQRARHRQQGIGGQRQATLVQQHIEEHRQKAELGNQAGDLLHSAAALYFLSGVVSGASPVSITKIASSLAGSVLLAFSLTWWCAPGFSVKYSPTW